MVVTGHRYTRQVFLSNDWEIPALHGITLGFDIKKNQGISPEKTTGT
jgi:hypothetical protein